ncbi:hypothetical protein AX16_004137 [Volvariella volvacea WC 439]|nr:hypothetical protein AX16_004137 [Volvariella volvacea WC 439]
MSRPDSRSGSHSGNNVGNKVSAAAHVVRGLGDAFRGAVMTTVDDVFNSKDTDSREISRRGRQEYEAGMAELKGGRHGVDPYTYGQGDADRYDAFGHRRSRSRDGAYSSTPYEQHPSHYQAGGNQGYDRFDHSASYSYGGGGAYDSGGRDYGRSRNDMDYPGVPNYGEGRRAGQWGGNDPGYPYDGGQAGDEYIERGFERNPQRGNYPGIDRPYPGNTMQASTRDYDRGYGYNEGSFGRQQLPPLPERKHGHEYGADDRTGNWQDGGQMRSTRHHRDDGVSGVWPNPAVPNSGVPGGSMNEGYQGSRSSSYGSGSHSGTQ